MKNFRIFPLLLALFLLLGPGCAAAQALDGPELSAQAVLLADLDSGAVLYEQNMRARRSPASLTKVMTLLLALEAVERGDLALDARITAGEDCRSGMRSDSSGVYIAPGEILSLQDLLYCAAVASANDACNVIAAAVGGSIPAFVARMNERAEELGCEQTRFVDPHGLSPEDLTSAWDLFLITREALRHPLFRELCDCASYRVSATNCSAERELRSSNALICSDGVYGPDYLYPDAHGVKTGYTRAAGYCLISTAERDGVRLLAIVLGCDGPYLSDTRERRNFTDTIALYNWAFPLFRPCRVFSPEEPVCFTRAELAAGGGEIGLVPEEELWLPLPEEELAPRVVTVELDRRALQAPIRAGEPLGRARLMVDGRELASVPLLADRDLQLSVWAFIARTVTSKETETGD